MTTHTYDESCYIKLECARPRMWYDDYKEKLRQKQHQYYVEHKEEIKIRRIRKELAK